ncbi:hypothetical protein FI667_g3638, partial [Globisporangium splendens]
MLEQFRTTVLGLSLQLRHIHVIANVASAGAIAFEYMLTHAIGFPLPFTLAEGVFVWEAIIVAMFAYSFGSVIRSNEQVRNDLGNAIGMLYGQILMSLAYPAFIYGFNAIDPSAQKYYVVLLPVLKLVFKNWISRFMGEYDDKKPENVIINVEFFNAIYVASCMQRSSSVSTTVVVVAADWIQMAASLLELNATNVQARRFLRAIPKGHAWLGKTAVEVAMCIIEEDERIRTHPSLRESCLHSGAAAFRRPRSKPQMRGMMSSRQTSVFVVSVTPVCSLPGQHTDESSATLALCNGKPQESLLAAKEDYSNAAQTGNAWTRGPRDAPSKPNDLLTNGSERLAFVQRVTNLLSMIEFVVPIEYVEVIVPIIYSAYIVAVYHLENRAYYKQIATIDTSELKRTISNVLLYAGLEIVSFVVISIIIHRRMRIATLKQLSFVLERQSNLVQTKLLTWFSFTVQNSLDHFAGYVHAYGRRDFTSDQLALKNWIGHFMGEYDDKKPENVIAISSSSMQSAWLAACSDHKDETGSVEDKESHKVLVNSRVTGLEDASLQWSNPTADLLTDETERLTFVQHVTELMFTTEFVVRVEYVEVIVLIIYSAYIVAMYYLENRVYYAHIAPLNVAELKRTVSSVTIFAGLEFLAFAVVNMTLYRRLGVAALKQLSFVLERQWNVTSSWREAHSPILICLCFLALLFAMSAALASDHCNAFIAISTRQVSDERRESSTCQEAVSIIREPDLFLAHRSKLSEGARDELINFWRSVAAIITFAALDKTRHFKVPTIYVKAKSAIKLRKHLYNYIVRLESNENGVSYLEREMPFTLKLKYVSIAPRTARHHRQKENHVHMEDEERSIHPHRVVGSDCERAIQRGWQCAHFSFSAHPQHREWTLRLKRRRNGAIP